MEQVTETRSSKGYFRSSPSTAFDQYLQDIQKLPLIDDPEEERRLARRAQKGDEKAAERLVTANLAIRHLLRQKYQGHGLDLSASSSRLEMRVCLKAVRKVRPGSGRQIHFIRGVVGSSGSPQGARLNKTRSVQNPAQSEFAAHSTRPRRNDPGASARSAIPPKTKSAACSKSTPKSSAPRSRCRPLKSPSTLPLIAPTARPPRSANASPASMERRSRK